MECQGGLTHSTLEVDDTDAFRQFYVPLFKLGYSDATRRILNHEVIL